jgi:hypothetical protein
MDRTQAKVIAAARGGSPSRSPQSTAADTRALAKARVKVASNAARATAAVDSAAAHRALAAKYLARKGA